uniref:chitin synthase n=1 Tax=Magallana gigas TaxID=29159 RepID=A0A8W8NUJ1_MAGGI|nr:uncharacterized protein LOC105341274 isoform X1 [Crassostrea gigas]XP_034320180.1 uncharacterized protein LOC105341274 isoform X1 [Crassostrea gigas]
MATPGVESETEDQQQDLSYLTVKQEFKDRSTSNQRPSKIAIFLKWVITLIFAGIFLANLVMSKLTLFGLVNGLKAEKDATVLNYQTYCMCFVLLLTPNIISLLRSLWNITGWGHLPWPNTKRVGLIALSAALESVGLFIVLFKTLTSGSTIAGVSAMQFGFIIPIIFYTIKGNRVFRPLSFLSIIIMLAGSGLIIFIYIKESKSEAWSLVGVVVVFLSMFPYLNNKIFKMEKPTTPNHHQDTQSGSINHDISDSSEPLMQGSSSTISYHTFHSSSSSNMTGIKNVTPDGNYTPPDNTSAWKVVLISAFFKIVMIISAIFILFAIKKMNFQDAWDLGWNWSTSDKTCRLVIAHIATSLVAYVTAVFACRTCIDRGAFLMPLLLSSPVVYILLVLSRSCKWLETFLDQPSMFCANSVNVEYSVWAMVCATLSIWLVYGRLFWCLKRQVLLKETQLFWYPTYNSVMLEQWIFLNKKSNIEQEKYNNDTSRRNDEKTRVYICTTMYRESRKEMQQLLDSIQKISQVTSAKICFESHIFLDGAVRENEMTEFALQLIGLLNDALHINDVLEVTKTWTPYGLKLSWRLPGPNKMIFCIHLKDSTKVKKKKRWSQIMYMSYILDFLSKQNVDRYGNQFDTNNFILTTDADVQFTPESVEALLDLMLRDTSVGAVCARTYPLGSGPVVWYQKFEYAVGHWFQKAAEHVLGSVLCAPGCFSVYRCSALRKILPKYASSVERAFDFLIKDMGEDRWLCTLMVQNGWRIEYCAASENGTYCPEEFEEFYKQRRRWIASTLANSLSLITNWNLIRNSNHRISYLFCLYQIILLVSTFIGPSTVIVIVAGGLAYAWNINIVISVVLQVFVCVIYAGICLFRNEKWQMQSGKLITFLYAVVMAAVFVGLLERIAKEIIGITSDIGEIVTTTTVKPTIPPGVISSHFPVSFVTLYLGIMCAIFVITTLLHPYDFTCLLNGFTYLLCLPSGYFVLNIYSIVNITDSSWGTREEKKHNSVKPQWTWYKSLLKVIKQVLCCFDRNKTSEDSGLVTPDDSGEESDSDIIPEDFDNDKEDTDNEEQKNSDEESENKQKPTNVEKWLPKGMKKYARVFLKNGFENTYFLGMLTETDLKRLGIKKLAHRINLYQKIRDIPKFTIPVAVPKDPNSWLHSLGLEIYKPNFQRNNIKSAQDMEALKSFTKNDIKEELGIRKAGHLRMILYAIQCLRIPTHEEKTITNMEEQIRKACDHKLENVNKEEYKFWRDLIQACLQPGSGAFSLETILKGKLQNLRNECLMISGIVNCLWIVIVMTLSRSIDLRIAGTDPLSLIFLVVFGFILVLQFVCMLIHRFTTLCHFIARAPYRCGQEYRTSISLMSPLSSEERAVQRLLPEVRRLMQNQ